MIKHSHPFITDPELRRLLAEEIYTTWKKARPAIGDPFFAGFRYGLSTAYDRIQQRLNANELIWRGNL